MNRRLMVAVLVVFTLVSMGCSGKAQRSESSVTSNHVGERPANLKCQPSDYAICTEEGIRVGIGDPMDPKKFGCDAAEYYLPKHACRITNGMVFGKDSISAIVTSPESTSSGLDHNQTKAEVREGLRGEKDAKYGANRALLVVDDEIRTYYLFEECPGSPDGDVLLRDEQLENSKLGSVIIATEQGLQLMGDYITHPCSQG